MCVYLITENKLIKHFEAPFISYLPNESAFKVSLSKATITNQKWGHYYGD